MKLRWIIILPILLLCAEEKELIIPLATRHFLSTVSVTPFITSQFADAYLGTLHEILLFDLNHNGSCYVDEKEGADFKVEIDMQGKSFTVLISSKSGIAKTFGSYNLSGYLASDRRVMHSIADELTQVITGKQGIASARILYALQLPEKTPDCYEYKSEIWEADYDGANLRQVTQEGSYCINPVFLPNKGEFTANKFLYVNYKKGQPKIYISSFNQPKGDPLVTLRGNQLLPAISSKGDMIAFISDASGHADLFVQCFDKNQGLFGKPIQAYSFPRSVQASPTFRPDGKKIAFVSDKDGTPRIFIIDTPIPGRENKPRPLCLTKNFPHNTCPAWSPDGTKLAYSAMIDGTRQIMIYDFLTQEEIQLTTGKVHKENPCWAPNSLHLIYNSVDPSSSELFIINIKQKESLQITKGPGKKHYPAWEPK